MTNLEQFLANRRTIVGGSDIGSILNVSKWSCALRVYFSKVEEKDFDFSQKKEFRRGHRLEAVAAAYYEEKTGRPTESVELRRMADKPYLGVHMDRVIESEDQTGPGYLEIKVVGEWSFKQIKKEGAYADWIAQVHYGCRVTGCKWGSIAVYWADGDELLHWDFEADAELGEQAVQAADDFWLFHVEPRFPPEPIALGSETCRLCEYRVKCPNGAVQEAEERFEGVVDLPALAPLARDLQESKGFGKEIKGRGDELKSEILALIKNQVGLYRWAPGEPLISLTEVSTDRFDAKALKAAHPDIHKKFIKTSKSMKLGFKGDSDE